MLSDINEVLVANNFILEIDFFETKEFSADTSDIQHDKTNAKVKADSKPMVYEGSSVSASSIRLCPVCRSSGKRGKPAGNDKNCNKHKLVPIDASVQKWGPYI